MTTPNPTLALLSYLLPPFGSLFVIFTNRSNTFALFHACQALGLLLIALITPIIWVLASLLVAWLPFVGPPLAASMFALVIAVYLAVVVAWVAGLVNGTQGRMQAMPIIGMWGEQIRKWLGPTDTVHR